MDYFKQVPMKYSHKTRLGNWSEEWELEQTKFGIFLGSSDCIGSRTT